VVNTATSIIKVRPGEKGSGIVVENKVVGGTIPKEFINPAKAAASKPPSTASSPVIR
jgi:hypothetical protein